MTERYLLLNVVEFFFLYSVALSGLLKYCDICIDETDCAREESTHCDRISSTKTYHVLRFVLPRISIHWAPPSPGIVTWDISKVNKGQVVLPLVTPFLTTISLSLLVTCRCSKLIILFHEAIQDIRIPVLPKIVLLLFYIIYEQICLPC